MKSKMAGLAAALALASLLATACGKKEVVQTTAEEPTASAPTPAVTPAMMETAPPAPTPTAAP